MSENRIIDQFKILENLTKADGGSELLERSLANDFVEWSSFYKMKLSLEKKLKLLS